MRKIVTCPECGYTNKMSGKERGARISKGLQRALARGERVGRKRKADYAKIRELKDAGHSISTIAAMIQCPRGSIGYVLRKTR